MTSFLLVLRRLVIQASCLMEPTPPGPSDASVPGLFSLVTIRNKTCTKMSMSCKRKKKNETWWERAHIIKGLKYYTKKQKRGFAY